MNSVVDSVTFSSFNFHAAITRALDAAGFSTPTPIQSQAIEPIMAGHDIVGLAQTGTGKTAAFVLPMVQQLQAPRNGPRALILVPTRELAEQVHEVVAQFGAPLGLRSMTIYGGVSHGMQVRKLKAGVDIIVACPGRLLDHMQQKSVRFDSLKMLVLDEADQMFDMGFLPTLRRILAMLPVSRQSVLFSATMPSEIRRLADEVLKNPKTVQVNRVAPAATVRHALYPIQQDKKPQLLLQILKEIPTGSVLVFTRTKHRAKKLSSQLSAAGHRATCLQGNLSQSRRQEAMSGFREGRYRILVATDIAARGIDIASVSHVINFDIPDTVEAYTHRIGRTGRASREGDAFTFITHEDESMVRAIEKVLGAKIERHATTLSEKNLPPPPTNERRERRHNDRGSGRPTGNGRSPRRGGTHQRRDVRESARFAQ